MKLSVREFFKDMLIMFKHKKNGGHMCWTEETFKSLKIHLIYGMMSELYGLQIFICH